MKKDTVLNVLFIVTLLYLTGGLLNKFCLKPFLEAKKEKARIPVVEAIPDVNPETKESSTSTESDLSSIDDISKTPVPKRDIVTPVPNPVTGKPDTGINQFQLKLKECDFREILSENGVPEPIIKDIYMSSNKDVLNVMAKSVVSDDVELVFCTMNHLTADKYETRVIVYSGSWAFRSYYDNVATSPSREASWREDEDNIFKKRGAKIYVDKNLSLAVTDNELDVIKYVLEGGELYGWLVPISSDTEGVYRFEHGYIEDSMYATEEEKAEMITLTEYVTSGASEAYRDFLTKNPPTPTPTPTKPSPKPIATPAPDSSVVHESALPDYDIDPGGNF